MLRTFLRTEAGTLDEENTAIKNLDTSEPAVIGPSERLVLSVPECQWLWLEDDDRAPCWLERCSNKLRGSERGGSSLTRRKESKNEAAERRRVRLVGGSRMASPFHYLTEPWRLAHAGPNLVNWGESRQILADLQPRVTAGGTSEPIQTARGSTLDEVAHAFGFELYHLASESHDPSCSKLERGSALR